MPDGSPKYFPSFLTRFWLSSADGPLLSSRPPRLHRYDVYDNEMTEIHAHDSTDNSDGSSVRHHDARPIFQDLNLDIIDPETRKEYDAANEAFIHLERDVELILSDLLTRTAWSSSGIAPTGHTSTTLPFDRKSIENIRKYFLFLRFRNSAGYAQVIESLELDLFHRSQPQHQQHHHSSSLTGPCTFNSGDGKVYMAYRPYILLIRLRVIFRKFAEFLMHTAVERPTWSRGGYFSSNDDSGLGSPYGTASSLREVMDTYCWRLCEAEVYVGLAGDDQEFILSDRCFGTLDEGYGEDPLCENLCFPIFPTVAVYMISLSDTEQEGRTLRYNNDILRIPVSTESAIDVHLRNAMLLQTYPNYLFFRSLRSIALSISSYDEFRWIQEHQDFSRLKQRCRQKFLQETVTKTLVVRDSLTVTDLSDEITVVGDSAAGHGSFYDVWRGTWHDPVERKHRSVALKFLRQIISQNIREKILRRLQVEIVAWHQVCHRNVIQFFGIVQAPMGIAMVSPWCEHGTLLTYLKKNPDANRLKLLTQAAAGIAHLHGIKPMIVHGDLRAGNILVDEEGQAVVNDFGLAKVLDDVTEGTMSASLSGASKRWMAPEIARSLAEDDIPPRITSQSDIYAFGCVCLEVATDSVPFPRRIKDEAVLLDLLREVPVKPSHGMGKCLLKLDRQEDAFWRMVDLCWDLDPSKRPAMSSMVSFFKSLLSSAGRSLTM